MKECKPSKSRRNEKCFYGLMLNDDAAFEAYKTSNPFNTSEYFFEIQSDLIFYSLE